MASAKTLPHPVRVRFSHATNRVDRDGHNTLEVTDERNGTLLFNLVFDMPSVAHLILGHGEAPAMLDHAQLKTLGKYLWVDEVLVPDVGRERRETDGEANLRAFEHDGWTCYRGDYGNGHRRVVQDGVAYFRVKRIGYRDAPQPERVANGHEKSSGPRDAMLGATFDAARKLIAELRMLGHDADASYRLRQFLKSLDPHSTESTDDRS